MVEWIQLCDAPAPHNFIGCPWPKDTNHWRRRLKRVEHRNSKVNKAALSYLYYKWFSGSVQFNLSLETCRFFPHLMYGHKNTPISNVKDGCNNSIIPFSHSVSIVLHWQHMIWMSAYGIQLHVSVFVHPRPWSLSGFHEALHTSMAPIICHWADLLISSLITK